MASGFVRELKRYGILALVVLFLQSFVSSFIGKYMTFLSGTIGTYALNFIAIFLLIGITDMILQRTL